MQYRSLVEKTWQENRLFTVLLELTYRCNLDCQFCYNDLSLVGRPLRFAQYRSLLQELARMGVLNVVLTGGEPLAHPRFFELGALARELGFVVRVKSNGHALDEVRALRLRREVDPFLVEISLHGATASTHDAQTRVAGSFERLLRNLGTLRSAGLRIKINSTLTRLNEGELEQMYEIADGLELPLQIDPEVTPRDNGDLSPLDLSPTAAGLRRHYEVLRERSPAARPAAVPDAEPCGQPNAGDAPRKHCGAGSSGAAIDPFGNVYPCVQWRRKVGSLHEHSLEELWHSSAVLETVRETTYVVRRELERLGNAAPTAFCPGAAEANTGSPLQVHAPARARAMSERQARKSLPVLG